MNYTNYSVEDFIKDEAFIRWVKIGEPELNAFWEEWVLSNPENKQAFMAARTILLNLEFKKEELAATEKSNLWEAIQQETTHNISAKVVDMKGGRKWLKLAVVVAILLMTSWGVWQFQQKSKHMITTKFGEPKEMLLSDGTKVILNANSSLTYYDGRLRKVWLEGEAYFEVAKKLDTQADFVVYTNDLAVRVLGTVFNVNSRNEVTEVFLEEGKVNLEIAEGKVKTIKMAPGELVSYSKKEKKLSATIKANAIENTAWKDGTLVFRDTPLVEVLNDLSEIYGVDFHLEDEELQQKLISGGVPIKNLKIALETLVGIYGIQIEEKENTYIIRH